MFKRTLLALSVLASPATADPAVEALIEEFSDAIAPVYAAYDHGNSDETLAAAFERHGSSDYYLDAWSGWIFVDFSNSRGWYSASDRNLRSWNYAVDRGDITQAEALAVLEPAMDRALQIIELHDAALARLTDAYGQRGALLDQAFAVGCCNATYYHFQEAAAAAMARGTLPDAFFRMVTPIPEYGAELAQPSEAADEILRRLAERDADDTPLWRDRNALSSFLIDLRAAGVPEEDPLYLTLAQAAERARLADLAPEQLLAEALELAEDSDVRSLLLAEAEGALEEQAAQMLYELAYHATASDEVDHDSLARAAELAIGLEFLRRRAEDPTSIAPPGTGVRLYHAARAGLELIEATGEAPEAHEWRRLTNDLARATQGEGVPVTAAFALPAGAVAGQVQVASDGFHTAAEALNGVADAIGGDPDGLNRALAAAERLQEQLNPSNFIRSMVSGAAEGFVSIVPGGREILGAIFG
ncbi:hypothetical protein HKCCE4037_17845 [Rhodobacterales bacterium HKCCE4037]|nr:hypothetical protein [Rhodobacterales bacterium HKCCE4037]